MDVKALLKCETDDNAETIKQLVLRIDKIESVLQKFNEYSKISPYPKLGAYVNGKYCTYCKKCKKYDMVSEPLKNIGVTCNKCYREKCYMPDCKEKTSTVTSCKRFHSCKKHSSQCSCRECW
jgi:hypothetical protein